MEIFWTGMASLLAGDARLTAQTYLWMFPIYGLAVAFEPLHELIRNWRWPVRGFVWTLVFFITEYLTGWLIMNIVGVSPWNYFSAKWQVNGLIRLDYAPVWFVVGLLFEQVHDRLKSKAI